MILALIHVKRSVTVVIRDRLRALSNEAGSLAGSQLVRELAHVPDSVLARIVLLVPLLNIIDGLAVLQPF